MFKRLISWITRSKPARVWYAVRHDRTQAWFVGAHEGNASITYDASLEFGASMWFDEPDEAALALVTAHEKLQDWQLIRLSTQLHTNHYKMEQISWH